MNEANKIYIDEEFSGILTEDPDGYHFVYDEQYMAMPNAKALSPTMPFQEGGYEKEMMFPVFDGLIPEGWMLDMCQLSNRLTEHKYRGAYTQLADVIKTYSAAPMLDVQRFWEIVIFSWITGNSDMHCKNFSLLDKEGIGYTLSPAYDLLAVALTGIDDKDELAMPLTGYGVDDTQFIAGFDRSSFIEAMEVSGIEANIGNKLINRLIKNQAKWVELIDYSFLSMELKERYKIYIKERIDRIS